MKRDWMHTRFGINAVGIGVVAVCVGVAFVLFHDVYLLAAGTPPEMWRYDRVLSDLAAGVGALFSIVSFFVFRPGLPRCVAAILAISLASYVFQPLLPVHGFRTDVVLCVARIAGCSSLLLLAHAYVRDLKAGRGKR